MRNVARHTSDKRLLKLVGRHLRVGIMDNDYFLPSHQGLPQGGPLSSLLQNIMFDDLDRELKRCGYRFVRYVDGFIILVGSERAGKRVLCSLPEWVI